MTESLEPHDGSALEPTIPVRYVREMLGPGGDHDAALAAAGIGTALLDAAQARVDGTQLAALYRHLLERDDDELFGTFARRVPRGTFATVARLATGCRDMRAAFEAAWDLYALFDEGRRQWSLDLADDAATLTLLPPSAAQASSLAYTHLMLIAPWRLAGWVTGHPFALLALRLNRRFADFVPESRFLFGCDPVLVDEPSAIQFEASLLDLPVRRTRAEADAWCRRASFAAMLARAPRDSLEARVRHHLAAAAPVGGAKLGEVAARLGMAPQTLARRLRELGTSFQPIKDRVRRDHAIALLAQGIAVAEVADALGFSEPSAFGRAFKQWTGSSPGSYRRVDSSNFCK